MDTQRAKVPFHIASIPRPQDVYRILVNNVNKPFEHVWLQRSEDGSRFIHPLEKLSVFNFVDKNVSDNEPAKPPPVESTPFKLVQEVKDLKELVAKLRGANEFGVDLEHNQYRSFQGLTCLMQISTRTEDFIVDTLKLRVQIGPYMREIFKDPTKRKVMHGADRDILWLQRDFGIYVCNMFDTGQASRVLKMERNSLEYLLQYFCGVAANKEYQTADWRLRPLTDDMLRYAREDTHYLLHIYDLMKIRLLSLSTDLNCPEALLVEVYQHSYNICMQLYQKDVLTEYSYLNIYGLPAADLNGQQLAVVAGLCEWRDVVARAEDESTGYILPNKSLIQIAKHMPVTIGELCRLLRFKHPYIECNLSHVVSIIQHCMQNAAMFEDAAKRLKEERLEMEAVQIAQKMSEEDSVRSTGAAGAYSCSNDVANIYEIEIGSIIAEIKREESSEHAGGNGIVIYRPGLTSTKLLHSGSRASVRVQKIPSLVFGEFLENAAGMRKFDLDTKAMEETKFEQTKSSVNFPVRFCTEKSKPLHRVMKEPAKPRETPNHRGSNATCSKPEGVRSRAAADFISFGGIGPIPIRRREEKAISIWGPMAKQKEGGSGRLLEVLPFDYAVVGKEVRFREDRDKGKGTKVNPEKGKSSRRS